MFSQSQMTCRVSTLGSLGSEFHVAAKFMVARVVVECADLVHYLNC